MSLVGLGRLLDDARKHGYGLLAANVITLEHAEALIAAAADRRAPLVLQISQNAVRYHGSLGPLGRACRALAEGASVPIGLHLDHATTIDLCREAADLGFGSVMFDASDAPDDENVARTADVARWAHRQGLAIEAEIGIVGGKDGDHQATAPTEPEPARDFVKQTGVDALAVQVGTSHARTDRTGDLDLARIAALHAAVPVPLVLHGSSGVADAHLASGIAHGLVKVNVGTRFNVAFSGAVREGLAANPASVDPRRYLADARRAMTDVAAELLDLFGASGRG